MPDHLTLRTVDGKLALCPIDVQIKRGQGRAWLFRFVDEARVHDSLLTLLSDDERARTMAFRVSTARNQYVQTRAVLRLLLGRVLNLPPEVLRFQYGSHGKPALRDEADWYFNVAHSGDYALLAVSSGVHVGVDIERQRVTDDLDALAHMVLSPDEAHEWTGLPHGARVPTFFSVWTAKEAVVKAMGCGLGLGLTTLDLGALGRVPEGSRCVVVGDFGACKLMALSAPAGYSAALALHEVR